MTADGGDSMNPAFEQLYRDIRIRVEAHGIRVGEEQPEPQKVGAFAGLSVTVNSEVFFLAVCSTAFTIKSLNTTSPLVQSAVSRRQRRSTAYHSP